MDDVAVREKDHVAPEAVRHDRAGGGRGLSMHRVNPFGHGPVVAVFLAGHAEAAFERKERPRFAGRGGDRLRFADPDVAFADDRSAETKLHLLPLRVDRHVELFALQRLQILDAAVELAVELGLRQVHLRQLVADAIQFGGGVRGPLEEDGGLRFDDVALVSGVGKRRRRDHQEKQIQPEWRPRKRSLLAAVGCVGHYRTQERAACHLRTSASSADKNSSADDADRTQMKTYASFGLTTILAIAISTSAIPNVTTMVAPVGRSILNDRKMPTAVTSAAMIQPRARRFPIELAKSMAATEGTIR